MKKVIKLTLALAVTTVLMSSCYRHSVCATYVNNDVQLEEATQINESL